MESEAGLDARGPLTPSSRFNLLARVSITAVFSLEHKYKNKVNYQHSKHQGRGSTKIVRPTLYSSGHILSSQRKQTTWLQLKTRTNYSVWRTRVCFRPKHWQSCSLSGKEVQFLLAKGQIFITVYNLVSLHHLPQRIAAWHHSSKRITARIPLPQPDNLFCIFYNSIQNCFLHPKKRGRGGECFLELLCSTGKWALSQTAEHSKGNRFKLPNSDRMHSSQHSHKVTHGHLVTEMEIFATSDLHIRRGLWWSITAGVGQNAKFLKSKRSAWTFWCYSYFKAVHSYKKFHS